MGTSMVESRAQGDVWAGMRAAESPCSGGKCSETRTTDPRREFKDQDRGLGAGT